MIPECPNCQRPTVRMQGASTMTSAYYPPIYDENGVNINPDRNTITTTYRCLECSNDYTVTV